MRGKYEFDILLNKIESNLTNTTISSIIKCLDNPQRGILDSRYTAVELCLFYSKKAILLNNEFNFISEFLFESAMAHANQLDKHFLKTKKLYGPLHGIPFVLNDNIDVKGYDSAVGCKCGVHKPKFQNSPIVTIIKNLGGIAFIKTNVSFHLLLTESCNLLIGQSINPTNFDLSTGGSGGGLASCVKSFAEINVTGIGTDHGGGLRIPAQNCQLYALKPTSNRFPSSCINNNSVCFQSIPQSLGPLTNTLDTLIYSFKTIVNSKPHLIDPSVVPLPFNEEKFTSSQQKSNLKFGYFTHDGFFRSSPPCSRAVLTVVRRLREEGIECVEITIPPFSKAMITLGQLLTINLSPFCTSLQDLKDTELAGPLIPLVLLLKAPRVLRYALAMFIERVMDDKTAASLVESVGLGPSGSANEDVSLVFRILFWWWYALKWAVGKSFVKKYENDIVRLEQEKEEYHRLFSETVWNDYGIDCIISPVNALPPLPPSSFPYSCSGSSYSTLYSYLDLPSGVLPNITNLIPDDKIKDTIIYVHGNDQIEPSQDPRIPENIINTESIPHPRDIPLPPHIASSSSSSSSKKTTTQNVGINAFQAPPMPPIPHAHNQALPNQRLQTAHHRANEDFTTRPRLNFLAIMGMEEYNMQFFGREQPVAGVSVGVQVIGRRFGEEMVLGAMLLIEKVLNRS